MLFFLAFLPLVFCGAPHDFTTENFDLRVKEKPHTLVMFHAPWCGHCKRLKPHFTSASERLAGIADNVALAFVDCTAHEETCSKHGVTGYPTVKLFKEGVYVSEFDGSRDEEGIVNYMLQRSRPASVELITIEQLSALMEGAEAAKQPVITSFVKSKEDPWLEKYMGVASDMLGQAVFAHTTNPSILAVSGNQNSLFLHRPRNLRTKLEDSSITYEGELTGGLVKDWIVGNGHGLVGYRTPSNLLFFPMENILVFYHNVSMDSYVKGVTYFRNRLMKVIQTVDKGDPKLVYAYSYSNDFYHELNDLQPGGSTELPFVAIFAGGRKYKLEKYSPDALADFVNAFKAGTLTPYVKSEDVPTEQSGPLTKVVGHTFDSLVNDPARDAFVMFHAPWCGHCKQLMPKFEAAAERLKDEFDILMAIYDATANEVPKPYDIRGYPTLYFVSKNAKQSPKRYEGARETEDLIKFVAGASTQELKGYDRNGAIKKEEL